MPRPLTALIAAYQESLEQVGRAMELAGDWRRAAALYASAFADASTAEGAQGITLGVVCSAAMCLMYGLGSCVVDIVAADCLLRHNGGYLAHQLRKECSSLKPKYPVEPEKLAPRCSALQLCGNLTAAAIAEFVHSGDEGESADRKRSAMGEAIVPSAAWHELVQQAEGGCVRAKVAVGAYMSGYIEGFAIPSSEDDDEVGTAFLYFAELQGHSLLVLMRRRTLLRFFDPSINFA